MDAARQQQLLGIDVDGDLSALMMGVLEVKKQRDARALKQLIEKDRSGGVVTRTQFSRVIAEVMGTQRERQLLGADDEAVDSPGGWTLITQVLNISFEHDKAALRSLIHNAKYRGNALSKQQLNKAIAQLVGDQRQRQLLGLSDSDAGQEISDLMAEAATVFARHAAVGAKVR